MSIQDTYQFYTKHPHRNDIMLTLFSIPLYISGIGRYGLRLFAALFISVFIGALIETVSHRLRKRNAGIFNFCAWVLFPLILPPLFPLWMTAISLFFGILIAVVFFGGHGNELASPVAVGWTFASLSFPVAYGFGWTFPFTRMSMGFTRFAASLPTIDHPVVLFGSRMPVSVSDVLFGRFPQPAGSALPIVVIICGLLLILLRAVDFQVCGSFFASFVLLQMLRAFIAPDTSPPFSSLLIGNTFIAGFYILSNHRIAPRTMKGRWITGCLTGMIAFLIRNFSSFPDGVFFAVLFGNTFSAIIDEWMLKYKFRSISV